MSLSRTNELGKSLSNQYAFNSGCFKIPKLDFPSFDGTNVHICVQKANCYFQFNHMGEHKNLLFVSLHLQGRAELWYQTGEW